VSRPSRLAIGRESAQAFCFSMLIIGIWGVRKKPVRAPRTGANSAASIASSSMHKAFPLAVILSEANRHDITQLDALVDAIPKIRGKRGRPLHKPKIVQGDRGYSPSHIGNACVSGASNQCLQKSARPMARDGAKHVGRSNVRLPGFTRFDG
jgi:hypothetical protein